jgi:hypothetical protein
MKTVRKLCSECARLSAIQPGTPVLCSVCHTAQWEKRKTAARAAHDTMIRNNTAGRVGVWMYVEPPAFLVRETSHLHGIKCWNIRIQHGLVLDTRDVCVCIMGENSLEIDRWLEWKELKRFWPKWHMGLPIGATVGALVYERLVLAPIDARETGEIPDQGRRVPGSTLPLFSWRDS